MKKIGLILVGLQLVILPFQGLGADIFSATSGSWSTASTWIGGVVPGMGDNVTIQSGHTVTVSTGSKACNDLMVQSGGALLANSSSGNPRYIDVYGSITCHGTIGNGTTYDVLSFSIEGDTCVIGGTGTFNAARIKKTQTAFTESTLILHMNVILRYGGTALFDEKPGTRFFVVVDSGFTLNLAGNDPLGGGLSIDGTAGNGGTIGGSVTVNGILIVTGKLFLTTNNTVTAYPVSFTIGANGIASVDSVVCTASGAAGHSLTIANGGKLNLTGSDWGAYSNTNNTYAFLSGSIVEFSGSAPQTVAAPANYSHLTISGSGVKSIQSALQVNGNLTIQNGASLSVDPGKTLTVSGDLILGGNECLILESPSDSTPAGSFIPVGTVLGSGTIKVERYLTKYQTVSDARYHMLSSPVIGQQIQPGFVTNPPSAGDDFYRYDEPQTCWINSKSASGEWNTAFQPSDDRTFLTGRGYLVAYPIDGIRNFSGFPNTGNISRSVSYTPGAFEGYNLVGNPYQSALNGDIDIWTKSNVMDAIWVWDGTAGNYRTWNGNTGTLQGGIIPAMQGFFICATASSPSLTIPATSRLHHTQSFYKQLVQGTLFMEIFSGGMNDGTVLCVKDSQNSRIADVPRMDGYSEAPGIWTIKDEIPLSIHEIQWNGDDITIPIGIKAGMDGDHLLRFTGALTFPGNISVELEDKTAGTRTDVKIHSELTLPFNQGSYTDRFVLHLRTPSSTEYINPLDNVQLYATGNSLYIKGLDDPYHPATLVLYDLSGHELRKVICTQEFRVALDDLSAGIYIAMLTCNNHYLTLKIYVGHENK